MQTKALNPNKKTDLIKIAKLWDKSCPKGRTSTKIVGIVEKSYRDPNILVVSTIPKHLLSKVSEKFKAINTELLLAPQGGIFLLSPSFFNSSKIKKTIMSNSSKIITTELKTTKLYEPINNNSLRKVDKRRKEFRELLNNSKFFEIKHYTVWEINDGVSCQLYNVIENLQPILL